MAAGGYLGIDQAAIDQHFKYAAGGGDELQRGNFALEIFKQFVRQTDGTAGVVSNSAVFNADFEHGVLGPSVTHTS